MGKEVRIALDTNVFISGLVTGRRTETSVKKLVDLLIRKTLEGKLSGEATIRLVFPKMVLDEFLEILDNIFSTYEELDELKEIIRLLYEISIDASPDEIGKFLKEVRLVLERNCKELGKNDACNFDESDIPIIAASLACECDYFVTGDKKIHRAFCRKNNEPAKIGNMTILFPHEALSHLSV